MAGQAVHLESDAFLVCLNHALSTEKEEVMGLCIGEVSRAPREPGRNPAGQAPGTAAAGARRCGGCGRPARCSGSEGPASPAIAPSSGWAFESRWQPPSVPTAAGIAPRPPPPQAGETREDNGDAAVWGAAEPAEAPGPPPQNHTPQASPGA